MLAVAELCTVHNVMYRMIEWGDAGRPSSAALVGGLA